MIGKKKVGEYDAADPFFEGTIPEVWIKSLLEESRARIAFLHYSQGRVPYVQPPRHVRWRRAVKFKVLDAREWLALRIAPWLEPSD